MKIHSHATFFWLFPCLMLLTALSVRAQGLNAVWMQQLKNSNVKLILKEEKTDIPVPFASIYLIPQGDTTILDFTLSDKNGQALFRQIPTGLYQLNVEIMGYEPFRKSYHFRSRIEDLGVISLKTNAEFLQSATISATANPIRITKDTIEYNASSFRVSENAMLEDLLQKMPGIEIEEGKVKVNGDQVNKITVGGKTFFFNNSNAALKNLPARIIDKIKVIDRDKEEAAFSGVGTKDDQEKILDVGLKDQFKKGWFGTLKGNAGATATDGTNPFIEDEGLVYNANTMVSGYGEQDQFVLLGNIYNVSDPGMAAQMRSMNQVKSAGGSNDFTKLKGLVSSGMAGANYNTQRIKGMETTASLNYNHSTKNGREKSFRISYQPDQSEYMTDADYTGTGMEDGLSLDMEMKNNQKDRYFFQLVPQIAFNRNQVNISNKSTTREEEEMRNSNESRSLSNTTLFNHGLRLRGGIRQLGKEKRSLRMSLNYSNSHSEGNNEEFTLLQTFHPKNGENVTADRPDQKMKDLHHESENRKMSLSGGLNYVEPFGNYWMLETSFRSTFREESKDKDAFNRDGSVNDQYSTSSNSLFLNEDGRLVIQYDNDTLSVQLGVQAHATLNEIRSHSQGQDIISGKDEWNRRYSPFANLKYRKDGHRFYLYYTGVASQVAGSKILPILNITNPLHISTGNVYLRPSFNHHANADHSYNNRQTFTFLRSSLKTNLGFNGIVNAVWFDEDGVRYALPVNSRKPQLDVDWNTMFNQPFGPEKRFSFSGHLSLGWNENTSYQAERTMEGLDLNQFDYHTFMESFWGDASGDKFYQGESGFRESKTHSLQWTTRLTLKYTNDFLDLAGGGSVSNRKTRYSLDSKADTDIWNFRFYLNSLWQLGRNWEIDSKLSYHFFRGYSQGYGRPECLWNMTLSKNLRAFTFTLTGMDLLNQRQSLRHQVSNNYVEDSYTNVIGRHVLFGISYHFGKRDGSRNRRIERAMKKIL